MHSRAQARTSSRAGSARCGSPAAASPAAKASSGLMRLPPPSTEYRIAWCRRCGAIDGEGRNRSSVASVRAWTRAIQVVKSLVVGTGEVFQRVFFEHLHLLLGAREHALTVLRELQAALVRGERLLQGELSGLHAGDDFFQLRQRVLEALGLIGSGWLRGHFGVARGNRKNSPW